MKTKRTILQSIQKDIMKGFKKIYCFNFTKLKYFFLSINHSYSKNKFVENKISLICPTRERSKKFERMMDSLISTVTNISRIELLILIDEDDKEAENYKNIINNKYSLVNIKIFIKNFNTHAKRNNFLAYKTTGNIIFPLNDDMIFVSKNWDKYIDYEFSKVNKSEPLCLWIESGKKYPYLHCDFPIINRSWYERLGYVGSEHFNFWYLDAWICDLSFRSKKYLVTPFIIVRQISADTFINEVDKTHLRNRSGGIPKKDHEIWINTINERKNESLKLL